MSGRWDSTIGVSVLIQPIHEVLGWDRHLVSAETFHDQVWADQRPEGTRKELRRNRARSRNSSVVIAGKDLPPKRKDAIGENNCVRASNRAYPLRRNRTGGCQA